MELWVTNDMPEGTQMRPNTSGSYPSKIVIFQDQILFPANLTHCSMLSLPRVVLASEGYEATIKGNLLDPFQMIGCPS
jgi:hypothetical protein